MSVDPNPALFGRALEAMDAGVMVIDEAGRFVVYNRAAEEITGIPKNQLQPAEWQETYGVFHDDKTTPKPAEEMPIVRALSGERVHSEELFLRNPAIPKGRLLSVTATPLRNGEQIVGAVAVFTNITDIKLQEEAMRRAERLAALGVMAASVAHELNNPIMAAWASMEASRNLLHRHQASGAPIDPLLCESITTAAESMSRVSQLARNILVFARRRRSGRQPEDLNLVVEEALPIVRGYVEERGAALQFVPGVDVPLVEMDRVLLQQVVVNLAQNAAVAVADTEGGLVIASVHVDEAHVSVSLHDNGCGMSEATQHRATEPFFTTQSEVGTGLGLAIVDRIVTDHGGQLKIESSEGFGTCVTVRLPVSSPQEQELL